MDTAILTGLISGGAAILVCVINNYYQSRESEKKHAENIQLISYRLEQLEREVQKHNNLVERTYALEKKQGVIEEKINVANHRIDDLEKGA